jgi:hypothetical protein
MLHHAKHEGKRLSTGNFSLDKAHESAYFGWRSTLGIENNRLFTGDSCSEAIQMKRDRSLGL